MLHPFKQRDESEPILFLDPEQFEVHDGDWVYLETESGTIFCLEVSRTDHEVPNVCYEGQIRSFENGLGTETTRIVQGGLDIDQKVSFEEKHIFFCKDKGTPCTQGKKFTVNKAGDQRDSHTVL